MEIQVTIKNVYGNETIYPVCSKARLFAEISGHKTLTLSTIAGIKKLGYTVKVISDIKEL